MRAIALAGKPNAGKSTFYKAATMADVDVGNYPFTTIDPNRGVSHVRTDCPCLTRESRCGDELCRAGKRYVPVELIDVAGLVPGAHEGRGLGNQFLDALTDADVICNVVDASGGTNEEGEPVETHSYDPVQDVDFVEREMDLWLAGIVTRHWESIGRKSRSPDFDMDEALSELLTGVGATPYDVAMVLRSMSYPEDPLKWTDEDRETLARRLRRQTKPILVVANKADLATGETLDRLRAAADRMVACTAEGELALRQAAEAGAIEYDPGDASFELTGSVTDRQAAGLEQIADVMAELEGTGVQRSLNEAVYGLLDCVTAYPVQAESTWSDGNENVLPDAELLDPDATPTDLAYAVHSDIGDGYLHAVDARAGRRIGEDHELSEGAVVKIVSTAR
jgi:ribosome-binding ATPase YchF (GTP1/OBG family)